LPIIITILAFGIMIFIHELGHFVTAKKFGVLVHEFSMGMGPKIFSVKKGETVYSLRLLPIGGYVKLEGETESEDSLDPRSFINLSPLKRIIVLVSGAMMNLILGFTIFVFLNFNAGILPSVVDHIPEDLNQNLIKTGDEIVQLNNTNIHTYDDVSLFMSRYNKDKLSLTVKRDGKKIKFDNYQLWTFHPWHKP
jgi:regulator of sigma E protease